MTKSERRSAFCSTTARSACPAVRSSDTLLDHLRLARRAARHQGRLRRGRLRRLHGAGRPAAPATSWSTSRSTPASACSARSTLCHVVTVEHLAARRRAASGAAGDGRFPRLAVRLLHAGLRDVALRAVDAQARRRPRARSRRRCRATSAAAPATSRSSRAAQGDRRLRHRRTPIRWLAERAAMLGAARRRCDDGARVEIGAGEDRRDRAGLGRRSRRGARGRCRSRRSSPARPTSGSGSPSSCATSRRRSSSAHLDELQRDRRRRRRRRHASAPASPTTRLPGDAATREFPHLSDYWSPHRRRAGAQHGHDRRQHRQRLADRRHAAAADRAGRDGDAAQGQRRGARCRSRISSSPTASRTGSRASSSRRHRAACRRRARISPPTRSPSAATRTSPPSPAALPGRRSKDGTVAATRIAYGGMAATPKRAAAVEAALVGKPWTRADRRSGAEAAFAEDFTPLTDRRASADYRALVARNLLQPLLPRDQPASRRG